MQRALAPFQPPYLLGGSLSVVVGSFEGAFPGDPQTLPDGFRVLTLLGRTLVILIASSYESVPAELPIRYHELIAAVVARRGAGLLSVPFDMALDAHEPTELGKLHYGLPKRFDPAVHIERGGEGLRLEAEGIDVRASDVSRFASLCVSPLLFAATLGVRLVTSRVDVLGAAHPPLRRARIALRPTDNGACLRVEQAMALGRPIRTVWCQSWNWVQTTLGAPRTMEDEHG